jgi:hypothetical protein
LEDQQRSASAHRDVVLNDRKINSPRQYASADKDDNGRKPRSVVRLPKIGLGHGTGAKKRTFLDHNFATIL